MRKQHQLTPQQSIKMFLGMLLLMAIMAILTSCESRSGKRTIGPEGAEHSKIGENFRAKTSEGITIAAYTSKPALHRVGDTVIVVSSSDVWTLVESPAFTRDTTLVSGNIVVEYKRVTIIR